MNTTHLNQWLSDPEVKAIYWTLIHSLWEGLLIAALAGLVIATTCRASAKVRYRLFCTLLVLFTAIIGCTFIYEVGWTTSVAPVEQTINLSSVVEVVQPAVLVSSRQSLVLTISKFLNNQALWIFAIWLVCFLYKSFRILGGVFYIYRIRTQSSLQTTKEITDRVKKIARRIGISKSVSVIHSKLVKVPVTLGYLKPMIVLPVSIMFQLDAEQVDAILWHELAHIRRRDYLVNILQSMVEAAFFFNPAVLWLSALIREEREACCDDIVLASVQQKGCYMEALMAFHGQYASVGSLAMALSLRPNQLMNRLRRMVYHENKKLSFLEMTVLLAGMLLFSAFIFIPQATPLLKNRIAFIGSTITHQFTETRPLKFVERRNKLAKVKSAPTSNLELSATPLVVNSDTAIVFKSIRFNKSNGDKLNREMNVIDGQNNQYHILIVGGKTTAIQFNNKTICDQDLDSYANLVNQIDAVLAAKLHDKAKVALHVPNPVKKSRSDISRQYAPMLKEQNKIRHTDTALTGIKPIFQKKTKVPVDISADQARARGLINELVRAKVVSSPAEVESFGLSDTELTVNGQNQPDALQQKLKEAYGIRPNYGLYYGPVKTGGQGIVLDKNDLY